MASTAITITASRATTNPITSPNVSSATLEGMSSSEELSSVVVGAELGAGWTVMVDECESRAGEGVMEEEDLITVVVLEADGVFSLDTARDKYLLLA